ncbi:MAG: hypothetical protein ABI887_16285 [Burkholderiales bacterium]
MTTLHFRQKERGAIQLGCFALVNRQPLHLHFGDHGVPVRNAPDDSAFITAAYGTSANAAFLMASDQAESSGEQSFRLHMIFKVRGGMPSDGAIDRETAYRTGFLHMGRLERKFREEIRQEILEGLCATLSPAAYAAVEHARLAEILVRYPAAVRALLDANELYDVVVHPAMPAYRSKRQGRIDVATIRSSRAADMKAHVRYLEHCISASGGRSH